MTQESFNEAPDSALLERWRAGDAQAGNALFRRHFKALNRFFRNKVDEGVEDLLQNTFLACVEGRDKFRGRSSFRTYLFAIARYQLYAHFRKRGRAADFTTASVVDMGSSPSRVVARKEEQRVLLRALRSIPVDYQIALELTYWEELKGHELAEILDVPTNTIRSRVWRARRALRRALEQQRAPDAVRRSTMSNIDEWARSLRAQLPQHGERE